MLEFGLQPKSINLSTKPVKITTFTHIKCWYKTLYKIGVGTGCSNWCVIQRDRVIDELNRSIISYIQIVIMVVDRISKNLFMTFIFFTTTTSPSMLIKNSVNLVYLLTRDSFGSVNKNSYFLFRLTVLFSVTSYVSSYRTHNVCHIFVTSYD